jgi:branched-subunit amino acid transport protein
MAIWLTLIIIGLLTFLTRLSFIALLERLKTPPVVQRALRFVPIAVLTAIFVPELILPNGALDITPGNPRLLAGLVAILVAWRTKNVILTIVAGMVIFLLMRYLF